MRNGRQNRQRNPVPKSPSPNRSPLYTYTPYRPVTETDIVVARRHVETLLVQSRNFLRTQLDEEMRNTAPFINEKTSPMKEIASLYHDVLLAIYNIEVKLTDPRITDKKFWDKVINGFKGKLINFKPGSVDKSAVEEIEEMITNLTNVYIEAVNQSGNQPMDSQELMEALYALRDAVAQLFYDKCVLPNTSNLTLINNFIILEWKTLKQLYTQIQDVYKFRNNVQNSIDDRFKICLDNFKECYQTYRYVARSMLLRELDESEIKANLDFHKIKSKESDILQRSQENDARLKWYKRILNTSKPNEVIFNVINTRGELYDTIGQMGTFDAMA